MTAMRVAWLVVLVACSKSSPAPTASWPPGPFVRVTVREAHATPLQLEATVARPLENAIGARTRTAIRAGTVTIDVASQDMAHVREAIDRHRAELPPDAEPPVIQIEQPVELAYAVRSETETIVDVTAKHKALVARLQQVSGVSGIEVCGEHELARVVEVDPERLTSFGVTAHDIQVALESGTGELMDRVIATRATIPVYVHDVARIRVEPRASCVALNFDEPIIIGKIRGSANPRELNNIIKASGLDGIVFPPTAIVENGAAWGLLMPDAPYVVGIVGSNRSDLEIAAREVATELGWRSLGTLGTEHLDITIGPAKGQESVLGYANDDDITLAGSPTTFLHVEHAVSDGPHLARELLRLDREPWVGVLLSWRADGVAGIGDKLAKVQLPVGVRWRIEKR